MKCLGRVLASVALVFAIGCGNQEGGAAAVPQAQAPSVGGDASTSTSQAVLVKNGRAPVIRALDIRGQEVDLESIIALEPDLVIEFFFSVDTGEAIALSLKKIDLGYRDSLRIIALGFREDEAALREFASRLNIDYFIIDTDSIENAPWLDEVTSLPLTLFVHPNDERRIVKVLRGAGEKKANVIREVAKNFFQQQKLAKAEAMALEAKNEDPDDPETREITGHILAAQGKLDAAEAEFGAIDSKSGLAKVALERGDYEKAISLAGEAGADDGYAQTVKGVAYQRQGKLDDAGNAFAAASEKTGEDWQLSEARNGFGRILHEKGDREKAIAQYRKAIELSPYNVVALSNEGAAQREAGNLDAAQAVLEKAQKWGGAQDELVGIALEQIVREQKAANDLDRLEKRRQMVAELGKRFRELQAAGQAEPEDPWTTRPQILAFLPTGNTRAAFFERAGMDMVIRREIEARLGADPRARVVERELINELLAELELGSSDVADKNTQLQLGKVLAAKMLGFIEFATPGGDVVMYTRLADAETTELIHLPSKTLSDEEGIGALAQSVVEEILQRVVEDVQLQGLIALAETDTEIIINLGQAHGVKAGDIFNVVVEGEPVMAGGRVVRHRRDRVAQIEVTEVEEMSATCKLVSKNEGVQLTGEMKILEPKS